MPNDEYYFYANLNFIFNYNEANKTILDSRDKRCHDKIGFIQNKTKTTASKVRTLQFNDSLKTQVLRQITNIDTVITGFSKKIRNSYDTILFVKKEANKLSSSKEPIDIKFKKSQILFEKLINKHSQIDMIERTLFSMEKHLNSITLNGNILEPSLDKILDILKKCLKETEEYNISKLKHAQKKFELSKELKDFMYGKRNPKLAHLLSLDSSVPVDSAKPLKLMTPFGPVWIQRSSSDSSRMIYLDQQLSRALKYDEMCEKLDWKFNPDFNSKVKDLYRKRAIEGIIKPIIEYINQPLFDEQNSLGTKVEVNSPEIIFNGIKHDYPISRYLTESQKEAAAFLCGVLLLSESHEFRNPTGGKFERKAMKNVLRLAENGCVNPFSKVFSNAKGRYIPAHDECSLKDSNGKRLSTSGGEIQANNIIDMSIKKIDKLDKNCFLFNFCTEANKYLKKQYSTSKKYQRAVSIIKNSKLSLKLSTLLTKVDLTNEGVPDDVTQILNSGLKLLELTLKYEKQSSKILDIGDLPDLPFLKVDVIEKFKDEISRNKKLVNKMMNNSV